ncbi:hypothetical protein ACIQMR_11360 [Streptomyces sp. NPDC091376]|uniref:hypothetical protein n=1 Tax=Streptomyces sp. NPDC091376 TaxID=3365994 RepID=UPI00380A7DB6
MDTSERTTIRDRAYSHQDLGAAGQGADRAPVPVLIAVPVLIGDAELNEGSAHEALVYAGRCAPIRQKGYRSWTGRQSAR